MTIELTHHKLLVGKMKSTQLAWPVQIWLAVGLSLHSKKGEF